MALFKISKGNKKNLPTKLTEGYAYFCEDTHEFYIDHYDPANNKILTRSLIRGETPNIIWHNHPNTREEYLDENQNIILDKLLDTNPTIAEELHIHNIANVEIYNDLVEKGEIHSDHLYMINGPDDTIKFIYQDLTPSQQAQARANIGAGTGITTVQIVTWEADD